MGKGIKYSKSGEIKFIGVYSNGKKWNGLSQKYYNNSFLKFKGKYLNGKMNGFAKEYHNNGELKFEGKYLHEIKINGKEYDNKISYLKLIKMEKEQNIILMSI